MPTIRLVLAAVIGLQLAGCSLTAPNSSEDTARRDALTTAVREAEVGTALDLRLVLGDDWDRVGFLGPYAVNELAEDVLAVKFDIEGVSPWRYTEGGTVVVLVAGADVVAWFGVPYGDVGLGCMDGSALPASSALVTVVEDVVLPRSSGVGPPRALAADGRHQCEHLLVATRPARLTFPSTLRRAGRHR